MNHISSKQLMPILAFLALTCPVVASSAYVTIVNKIYSHGSATYNYDGEYGTVGKWRGGQSLSDGWYEFGSTLGAAMISNVVPGPKVTAPFSFASTFDQRGLITYNLIWHPETQDEIDNGPSQNETSYWEMEVAHQSYASASIGVYALG